MEYRTLGRTGLKVSEICLGTMTFGEQVTEEQAKRITHRALEAGVNFFDTADAYVNGRSEEILGRVLEGGRDGIVLATKVANKVGPGVNDQGLSRKHVMQGVEASLRRLATDYIDLYYVHLPDYNTPIDETLRALDDLVHEGKVRYIACSNFRAWQLCKALWTSDVNGLARFDCIQPPYNLLTRDIEYELLPLCESEGVGVCVYNPLAAGLLTGKHDPAKPPTKGTRFTLDSIGRMYYERYWSEENFKALSQLSQIADQNGRNATQFALAWVLSNKTVTSAICGCTSMEHLEINLAASGIKLSEEELKACDGVWQQLRPLRFFYGR